MKCIDKYLYIQIGAFIYHNFSSLRNFRKMAIYLSDIHYQFTPILGTFETSLKGTIVAPR